MHACRCARGCWRWPVRDAPARPPARVVSGTQRGRGEDESACLLPAAGAGAGAHPHPASKELDWGPFGTLWCACAPVAQPACMCASLLQCMHALHSLTHSPPCRAVCPSAPVPCACMPPGWAASASPPFRGCPSQRACRAPPRRLASFERRLFRRAAGGGANASCTSSAATAASSGAAPRACQDDDDVAEDADERSSMVEHGCSQHPASSTSIAHVRVRACVRACALCHTVQLTPGSHPAHIRIAEPLGHSLPPIGC